MKLWKFDSDEAYIESQARSRRRKRDRPAHVPLEFQRIKDWIGLNRSQWVLSNRILKIMCHGASKGWEVNGFHNQFTNADIIGTDLESGSECVVEHDFRQQVDAWIRMYDILYSNSLDHADQPEECLTTWIDQLSSEGVMFIQWTNKHIGIRGGDCFGAELSEYITLLNKVGKPTRRGVIDLLYCGGLVVLIVVSNPR